MTAAGPLTLAAVLTAGLLVAAVLGPWLLRAAAPALVRVPRLAVGLLVTGMLTWTVALLALGPLLAWLLSGPVLLPGRAGAVCRQCLAAANPFPAAPVDTAVPALLLLAVPVLAAGLLAVATGRDLRRQARSARETVDHMLAGATRRTVLGHRVHVVEQDRPLAVALPTRRGGVVLSTGALHALEGQQLAAVLAHEEAHLRQQHHRVAALVAAVARQLRWVPLVAAAEAALGHYLEIAADDRARRRVGTTPLVSALLTLGERATPPLPGQPAGTVLLHAAGPERVRQLVDPVSGAAGALPAAAVTVHLVSLGVVGLAVVVPYLLAAVGGCL